MAWVNSIFLTPSSLPAFTTARHSLADGLVANDIRLGNHLRDFSYDPGSFRVVDHRISASGFFSEERFVIGRIVGEAIPPFRIPVNVMFSTAIGLILHGLIQDDSAENFDARYDLPN
jgi:hypothetical protein